MPDQEVYIVTRVITTQHNTAVSIPMGVFDSKESAEEFKVTMNREVNSVMALLATGPDGQVIENMNIGSFCKGLGIGGVGHKINGPVELSTGSKILRPGSSGGGIVIARS